MASEALVNAELRVKELEDAIRNHRDQRGDDRCWMDDEALYKTLPEGYIPPERDVSVEIKHCLHFISCRQNPQTEYISPQREIEQLKAQIERLQTQIDKMRGCDEKSQGQ